MSTKKKNRKTVLVFGIGKLGGPLVDILCKRYPQHLYILVSRDKERSQRRANLSRYMALQWGDNPEVFGEEVNLYDIARTAELIDKFQPDVVINATTPFPWWKINDLPEREKILANNAGPGVWCALDCVLPLFLTQALALTAVNPVHVNACYPDMTNAFLSSQKCRPQLGIGNISNLVPGLQLAFASELSVSPNEVEIRIVGHHYVSWNAPNKQGCHDAPYYLSVMYPDGNLHYSGPSDAPFEILRKWATRIRGLEGLGVTIGSAATLIGALLGSSQDKHHSPGANGLPGGYPVTINYEGRVDLNLPNDLSEHQAIEINSQAQSFDGISYVEAGKVMPTYNAIEAYSEILGTDLPEVTLSNIIDISEDTLDRLNKRFNLNLSNA